MAATVLVIEDYSTHRALLQRTVTPMGCRCIEASDGRTGLRLAEEHQPALVLLDLVLPDLDGLEVLRRLRALPATQHTPILVVTAVDRQERIVEALEAGADDYVTKPFQPAVLQARMKVLLRTSRLQAALMDEVRRAEATALMARAAATDDDVDAVCAEIAGALRLESGVAHACLFVLADDQWRGPYGVRGRAPAEQRLDDVLRAAPALGPLLCGEVAWLRMRGDELAPHTGWPEPNEVVLLPLLHGDRPMALAALATRGDTWRDERLRFLRKLTDSAALALVAVQERARRSQSDTRYRFLFEQATEGVAIVDPATGAVREANQTLAAWLSALPAALAGRSFGALFADEWRAEVEHALRQGQQGRLHAVEDITLHEGDPPRAVDVSLHRLRGGDVLALVHDRRSLEAVGQVEQVRGDLVSLARTTRLMIHEINNPLTCIIGLTQLLQLRLHELPEHRPQLDTILTSAERIAEYTQTIRAAAITLGGDATAQQMDDLLSGN